MIYFKILTNGTVSDKKGKLSFGVQLRTVTTELSGTVKTETFSEMFLKDENKIMYSGKNIVVKELTSNSFDVEVFGFVSGSAFHLKAVFTKVNEVWKARFTLISKDVTRVYEGSIIGKVVIGV